HRATAARTANPLAVTTRLAATNARIPSGTPELVEGWPPRRVDHRRLAVEDVVDPGVIRVRGEHQASREDLDHRAGRAPAGTDQQRAPCLSVDAFARNAFGRGQSVPPGE